MTFRLPPQAPSGESVGCDRYRRDSKMESRLLFWPIRVPISTGSSCDLNRADILRCREQKDA
ncbi:hypothetical protein [Methylobacterium trifolii]|uniref:hypothetical protein n=1 Tax=Methylobacterium trifolii TaxID=1003092 RepID=UPI001EDFA556|nr:hypothetical protein [Methylobacterium trifolii]